MGLYSRYVLPQLINLAMRARATTAERARWVPLASGVVLEVGIGSALNLSFYGANVERLVGVDPSPELWRLGGRRLAGAGFPVGFLLGSAEALPIEDACIDTTVTTWVLCSIPEPELALAEIRRVLKPTGRLVFVEHGRAAEPRVAAWQDRLNSWWRPVAGGCNMNRQMDRLIASAGFRISTLATGYSNGPKVLAYLYRGVAEPAR